MAWFILFSLINYENVSLSFFIELKSLSFIFTFESDLKDVPEPMILSYLLGDKGLWMFLLVEFSVTLLSLIVFLYSSKVEITLSDIELGSNKNCSLFIRKLLLFSSSSFTNLIFGSEQPNNGSS